MINPSVKDDGWVAFLYPAIIAGYLFYTQQFFAYVFITSSFLLGIFYVQQNLCWVFFMSRRIFLYIFYTLHSFAIIININDLEGIRIELTKQINF